MRCIFSEYLKSVTNILLQVGIAFTVCKKRDRKQARLGASDLCCVPE